MTEGTIGATITPQEEQALDRFAKAADRAEILGIREGNIDSPTPGNMLRRKLGEEKQMYLVRNKAEFQQKLASIGKNTPATERKEIVEQAKAALNKRNTLLKDYYSHGMKVVKETEGKEKTATKELRAALKGIEDTKNPIVKNLKEEIKKAQRASKSTMQEAKKTVMDKVKAPSMPTGPGL